jgi:hypothetical protein
MTNPTAAAPVEEKLLIQHGRHVRARPEPCPDGPRRGTVPGPGRAEEVRCRQRRQAASAGYAPPDLALRRP